jgi:hypothetical protein
MLTTEIKKKPAIGRRQFWCFRRWLLWRLSPFGFLTPNWGANRHGPPPGGSQFPAANLNQTVTKSKSAATIEDHPMQYFDNIAGKPERIGKVIGDGLAVLVYVFVLFLMFWHFA